MVKKKIHEEKIFCLYCKLPLEQEPDIEQGFHNTCYTDMLELNPEFRLLEQLNADDKQFLDKLRKLLNDPIPTTKEDIILFEDKTFLEN